MASYACAAMISRRRRRQNDGAQPHVILRQPVGRLSTDCRIPVVPNQVQWVGVAWFAGFTWKNLAIRTPKDSLEALGILVASFVDASALVAD